MKFFKKKEKSQVNAPNLTWMEADQNPWGIRLLDLRPITQGMLSTSADPQMAQNAISYRSDDGLSFVNQEPESKNEVTVDFSFATDHILAPGVLFMPTVMEHKWAIFFHQDKIIFVRSWLRKVAATAATVQENGRIYITKIKGQLAKDDPQLTADIARFLLISHALEEVFPAPLPPKFASDLQSAGLWAMSAYGNKAYLGTFTTNFAANTQSPIRSHSLLHIATARNQLADMSRHVESGIPINLLAQDGLAALHWSMAAADPQAMQHLLKLGADPNVRSVEGATPMMNAVQSNQPEHLQLLIASGADVNARDNRGFTSLHRAVEMNHIELVQILLKHGADPHIEASGYTPLTLAEMRGRHEIKKLLQG